MPHNLPDELILNLLKNPINPMQDGIKLCRKGQIPAGEVKLAQEASNSTQESKKCRREAKKSPRSSYFPAGKGKTS